MEYDKSDFFIRDFSKCLTSIESREQGFEFFLNNNKNFYEDDKLDCVDGPISDIFETILSKFKSSAIDFGSFENIDVQNHLKEYVEKHDINDENYSKKNKISRMLFNFHKILKWNEENGYFICKLVKYFIYSILKFI